MLHEMRATTLHPATRFSIMVFTRDLCPASPRNPNRARGNDIPRTAMTEYPVLKDLAIIFAVSLLVILLFHRIKLPALPGFIVAGVLLGPNALGLVSDVHQVESLAEVGVILLLFTIGIEFSLSRLREMGRQVVRSEEHTSELQSPCNLVCRLLLEKK